MCLTICVHVHGCTCVCVSLLKLNTKYFEILKVWESFFFFFQMTCECSKYDVRLKKKLYVAWHFKGFALWENEAQSCRLLGSYAVSSRWQDNGLVALACSVSAIQLPTEGTLSTVSHLAMGEWDLSSNIPFSSQYLTTVPWGVHHSPGGC